MNVCLPKTSRWWIDKENGKKLKDKLGSREGFHFETYFIKFVSCHFSTQLVFYSFFHIWAHAQNSLAYFMFVEKLRKGFNSFENALYYCKMRQLTLFSLSASNSPDSWRRRLPPLPDGRLGGSGGGASSPIWTFEIVDVGITPRRIFAIHVDNIT